MLPSNSDHDAAPEVVVPPENGPVSASFAPPLVGPREERTTLPQCSAYAKAVERARLEALVELLDDDSPTVYAMARRTLENADKLADTALRRALTDPRARMRGRARTTLARRRERGVVRRLLRHAVRPEIDLERALFLLGRLANPELDARPYVRTLDAMAREVVRRTSQEPDELSKALVLPQYLGNELGFIGGEAGFDHPDNIHLHRVLERKRGMPLTLTAVYLFVARRAGLHAAAIPMPGRILLRLYARRRALIVDPFQGGRLRTRGDCVRYLAQHGMVPRPEWFKDATDSQLFGRHVRNLMNSAQIRGLHGLTNDLARVAWLVQRAQPGAE